MSDTHDAIFDFGERLGLYLIVQAAALSAVSVSLLLIFVAYKRRQNALKSHVKADASDSHYFLNLMLAELLQAIGGLLSIQWIIEARVIENPLCVVQGAFKQLGDVGVALTSLAIALDTFCVLIFRWRSTSRTAFIVIGLIWLFIVLVIAICSAVHDRFYGNTGYWCWIREKYTPERIALEYFWLWACAGFMLVIYGIIALVMRGVVSFDAGIRIKIRKGDSRVRNDLSIADDDEEREAKAIANLMMFYPAVYIFCVLPVGIVRWLTFAGNEVPPGATMFAGIVFSSSGLLNALLYAITRPDLVTGGQQTSPPPSEVRMEPRTRTRANKDHGFLPDMEGAAVYVEDGTVGYQRVGPRSSAEDSTAGGVGFLPDSESERSVTSFRFNR